MTGEDATPLFVCHGCGATVDPARAFPFACPNAGAPGDDVDHVLVAPRTRLAAGTATKTTPSYATGNG